MELAKNKVVKKSQPLRHVLEIHSVICALKKTSVVILPIIFISTKAHINCLPVVLCEQMQKAMEFQSLRSAVKYDAT